MKHGGKRKGAGRPKGKSDKTIKEIRDILNNYSEDLLRKAYEMAMDGNQQVMNKLLDKILPSLNSVDNTIANNEKEPFVFKIID